MAKSQDFPPSIRDFGMTLSRFSNRYYDYDIFSDFIDYMICCLLWHGNPETVERLKSKYKEDYPKFIELYKCFLLTQHKNLGDDGSFDWYDVLGEIYETIASRSKASALGQFFTPKSVCDFMSGIVAPIECEELYNKKIMRVNDCASGSGRTLLAFNKKYPGQELYADDFDQICSKMSAINLAIHGCKGQVCNMNSLNPDEWYFGYQINPWQHTYNGMPHIVPIIKEQSFSWIHWQNQKMEFNQKNTPKIKTEEPIAKSIDIGEQITFF